MMPTDTDIVQSFARQAWSQTFAGPGHLIIQDAELVQASDLPEPVSTDPDDDKFPACALAGQSTTSVSGDSDLINVSGYCGIKEWHLLKLLGVTIFSHIFSGNGPGFGESRKGFRPSFYSSWFNTSGTISDLLLCNEDKKTANFAIIVTLVATLLPSYP